MSLLGSLTIPTQCFSVVLCQPIAEAVSKLKLVPPARYAEAEVFFG